MTALRYFKICNLFVPSPDIAHLIQHFPPTLETLDLLHCRSRTCFVSYPLIHIFILPHPLARLGGIYNIPASDLIRGLTNWGTSPTQLHLFHCRGLYENDVLATVALHCPRLTHLQLWVSTDPEHNQESYWGRRLPTTVPQTITELTLCQVVDSCVELRDFELRNVHGVTDRFLVCCTAQGRTLTRLVLDEIDVQVRGAGIVDVPSWVILEELGIRYSWHVGYEDDDYDDKDDYGGRREKNPTMDPLFVQAVKEGCPALTECQLGPETLISQPMKSIAFLPTYFHEW
ncbi:hypothetical protein BC938DRAFT_482337 [Jimgerdemannia flammicorona]|uniref:F-box domain-containing protein n=1 Tax=Jimgerdemannia flammicorona TaxID=994334 RepID=A0A433QED4_9FUNG|nr:hypothetical protein BC938DRAFT_482337 [Jimgerdemannia flammicorona]